MNASAILSRLDAGDRTLFGRWSLAMQGEHARGNIGIWRAITHCGGVTVSVLAALVPLWLSAPGSALRAAAALAAAGLALSHLIIQIVKKFVGRPRPSRQTGCTCLVNEPACFSFPSGHATAGMAVAFAYAASFPVAAVLLLAAAAIVGFSRVRLGVHYPGDVVAGQVVAIATDLALRALW